jgi:hypothetical protein
MRLDGGCLPPTDKTTPLQQLRTDLLLEYYGVLHLGREWENRTYSTFQLRRTGSPCS